MAEARYVGPLDEVLVPLPLGGEDVVVRGGVLETSEDHAEALCQQIFNWERVHAEAKPASPAKPKNEPAQPEEKE